MLALAVACLCGAAVGCDDAGRTPSRTASDADPVRHETVATGGVTFDVVSVDLTRADLRLFWRDGEGRPFRNAASLDAYLARDGRRLGFATNAGIFHPSLTPVGLHVEDGVAHVPLNTAGGTGNFFLKPNGVFAVDQEGRATIVETSKFSLEVESLRLATQSGPLLVQGGRIHPAFNANSSNRKVRSAVGVAGERQVVFVLSKQPVTFHALAVLLRDRHGCPDALYLDGVISKFHLPNGHTGGGDGAFTGLLAVVEREASP